MYLWWKYGMVQGMTGKEIIGAIIRTLESL